MGKIEAICISEKRGTVKHPVPQVYLIEDYGIEGDAHGGKWHRQVSLLALEKSAPFEQAAGAFGENLLITGIDLARLPIGTELEAGECRIEITQIGKECHSHCEIYRRTGDCIMPREGVFAQVKRGGKLCIGDEIKVINGGCGIDENNN